MSASQKRRLDYVPRYLLKLMEKGNVIRRVVRGDGRDHYFIRTREMERRVDPRTLKVLTEEGLVEEDVAGRWEITAKGFMYLRRLRGRGR